ncbi:MAG: acetyl-CoA C-acetyltransferase, partial [Phycisphaerae bacterium]
MLKNVYLAGGVRTPFGSFNGSLADLSAAQLGSIVIRHALQHAGVSADAVDEVMVGNVIGAGLGQNVARQASLGAGVKTSVGATTINKVCGSSMAAVIHAARAVLCGDAGLVVAGGTESMSNAPYLLLKARAGYRMGNGELVDSMIHDGLWDVYGDKHMGTCGDQCATKYDITREELDSYAIESYTRATKAWDDGFYKDEVVPVEVKTRAGTVVVNRDEDLGKFKGPEKLRALRP